MTSGFKSTLTRQSTFGQYICTGHFYARLIRLIGLVDFLSYLISVIIHYEFKHRYFVVGVKLP
ncbi:hypothetical protein ALT785_390194 [Alteromonas infernus]